MWGRVLCALMDHSTFRGLTVTLGNTGSSSVSEQGLESKLDLSGRDVMQLDTFLRAQCQPKHGGGKVPRVFSVVAGLEP